MGDCKACALMRLHLDQRHLHLVHMSRKPDPGEGDSVLCQLYYVM